MSSSVFFKFKSSKEPQRITFDGTGITVFELKREIINVSGLGDGTDFDLAIYDDSSNEEYKDDTAIIPRSSSVTARRLPASRPGYGKAARYVSGKMPINARNSYRSETKASTQAKPSAPTNSMTDMSKPQTEDERIAAMFAAEGSQWEQQQQHMANAKPVYHKGGPKGKPANVPDHDPPPGYVCYRCHEKGHWIQLCPTNDDPNFETKPKIKRTTGIPRSFMKRVEKSAGATDGLSDDSHPNAIMIDAEGNHVIVNPDTASWEKAEAKLKASAAQQDEGNSGNRELQDLGLECPIDKRMFVDPMKTPCCGKTYCSDCIENALSDSDLTCPNCGTQGVLIDNLISDDDVVAKIKEYETNKATAKKSKEQSKTPTPEPKEAAGDAEKEGSEKDPKARSQSPSKLASSATDTNSGSAAASNPKKRPAEEELKNERSPPKAPAAMLRKQNLAQQGLPPGFDPKFLEEMNKLTGPLGPSPFLPPTGPMGMAGPAAMMGMGMPNPMMMMGPNPMANPMMNMGGQWPMNPGMGGMGFAPQSHNFNNFNQGMMQGGGFQGQGWQGNQGGQGWGMNAGHSPSQPGKFNNFQQRPGFNGPQGGGDEDNAYFRKPVNPHRAQNRARRLARHNDYNTL
ncbi:DWNN-domain-containing protein [Trichodelitschia bisporula]|uniref:DWNN-domain-containing protein n=1 Tax=Trichodelitschia bisporula TaxID=703511 RepID=A0A6G1I2G0_9PEZI|nr:DWNN-domain-containing protein [Trichodelitschia bisporula]